LHSSKLFQIQAVLLQAFSKKALADLWDFNGLQASKTLNEVSPTFSSPPPSFRPISAAAAP